MEPQTKPHSTKREISFKDIKVRGELAEYKAWIGSYMVRGITKAEGVKSVLTRMSETRAELIDKLERIVVSVVENVAAGMETGAMDVGVYMGTYFQLGEYLGVAVKIQRVTHPRVYNRWWGVVRSVFRGYDGLIVNSRHAVKRYVEFPDNVDRAKLYDVICQTARIAYNAYGWAHRFR